MSHLGILHVALTFLIKANSYLFFQEINFGANALGSSRSGYAKPLLNVGQLCDECLYYPLTTPPSPLSTWLCSSHGCH